MLSLNSALTLIKKEVRRARRGKGEGGRRKIEEDTEDEDGGGEEKRVENSS